MNKKLAFTLVRDKMDKKQNSSIKKQKASSSDYTKYIQSKNIVSSNNAPYAQNPIYLDY